MKRQLILVACVTALALTAVVPAYSQVLFEENFDSLLPTLGGSVNERLGTAFVTREASDPDSVPVVGVWSATTPGWTTDNTLSTYDGAPTVTPGVAGTGLTDYGVDEWDGWSFSNKDFWIGAAGDQDRSDFTFGTGTVAVVDPDEYFDLGSQNDATNGGYYSSSMTSPSFAVAAGGFYGIGFDSSWDDEAFDDSALGGTYVDQNNQSAEVLVNYYDAGGVLIESKQAAKWNSDSSDPVYFKDGDSGARNEQFPADGSKYFSEAPVGAASATLSFNIANAANDWWWAVDNIQVDDLINGGTVLSEDFEDTTLGDSVNERLANTKVTSAPGSVSTIAGTDYPTASYPEAFTHTAPAGWSVDTTIDAANEGDNNVGVFEWEQWSFATPDFWTFADTQDRELFSKGTGVIAIADGDEWTDLGSPTGKMLTAMETPAIDVSSVDEVILEFDSSYRSEGGQTIMVQAILDGDELNPVTLLLRDGTSGDFVDESVMLQLATGGASTAQFVFTYEGGNNWWWALDNIKVSNVPEPSTVAMLALALVGGLALRSRRGC